MYRSKLKNGFIVVALLSATLLMACRDDKNRASSIEDDKQVPTMKLDSLDIDYTESGLLRMKLKAPVMQRYMLSNEPYTEFPQGLHILFYTAAHELESEIIADYAINNEKPEEKWTAVGNVVIHNYIKKQSLYTDTLYWNRVQRKIYNYSRVRVVTPTSELVGDLGVTSDEQFTEYELRWSNEGYMYVGDDPQPSDSTGTASPAPSGTITSENPAPPPVSQTNPTPEP